MENLLKYHEGSMSFTSNLTPMVNYLPDSMVALGIIYYLIDYSLHDITEKG